MKRIITSFKNANKDVLNAISKEYPRGVEDDELINFPKAGGGTIRALEIEIDDTLYLVKMENEDYYRRFLAKDDDEEDDDDVVADDIVPVDDDDEIDEIEDLDEDVDEDLDEDLEDED
ncbi:MAG: hypothetical protein RLZZ337_702 [Bacteroidota bacterium]|jgi:hypothetical protein